MTEYSLDRRQAGRSTLGALAVALVALLAAPATAQTITGEAEATKPYAFTLGDYTVYLLGVDAPEIGQSCTIDGDEWECWAASQRQLQTILFEGEVVCEIVVGPDSDNHVIATCTVGGEDIGERFVRSGLAVTLPRETEAYQDAQTAARQDELGLWQGRFTPPSVWRSVPRRPASGRPAFIPNED